MPGLAPRIVTAVSRILATDRQVHSLTDMQ